jgi:hypothetical protein
MKEQDMRDAEHECVAKKLGKVMLSCITIHWHDEMQFGSVRREIFIAFAQPGAANSLHPLLS